MLRIGRLINDFIYIFLNFFVNRIPSWRLRKIFYLLLGMRIGKGSRIGLYTVVINPKKISIGNNCIVNEFCHLDGRGGLIIGNNTSISIYSKVITASHSLGSFDYFENKVVIGNNVWLGCGAIILDGSVIGDMSVVGAGSVVKGKIGDSEIWIGNPAKKIKKREIESEYLIEYRPYFR